MRCARASQCLNLMLPNKGRHKVELRRMKSTLILLALNALAVAVVASAAGGDGVQEERIQVTFVPKHKEILGAYTEKHCGRQNQ